MSKVGFEIGGITITWYSICILMGVILASIIISKEAKKKNISQEFVSNLVFWCMLFGIIGARIYYVIFNLDYYMAYPLEIIKIWKGGLAIHGGLIGGFITLIFYCRKYKINSLLMLDIVTPGLILAQSIGRWGNFFNSEAHGGLVTKSFLENIHLPNFIINGMHIGNNYYHPTFLYESLFCFIGFLVLIFLRKSKKLKTGTLTSIYMIWYGVLRFFIESLRTDSLMLGSNIKIAQLVSVILVILGVLLFIISNLKLEKYNEEGVLKNAK